MLADWLARLTPHPDSFVCGVRRPDGAAERSRWRYRRSWVDPWHEGEVVTIRHGERDRIRVRLDADPWWHGSGPRARAGFTVVSGRSADSGRRLLLAVPPGELSRVGL